MTIHEGSAAEGAPELEARPAWGDTACGRLIASRDWARTSLGPIETWSPLIVTHVSTVLASPVPMALLWGQEGVLLYNDSCAVTAGRRHPEALGQPVGEAWPEIAEFFAAVLEAARRGESLSYTDVELALDRDGRTAPARFDLGYSPVRDADGRIQGVLAVVQERSAALGGSRPVREAPKAGQGRMQKETQGLGTIGHLTGGFAHDFNNLLMPIVAALDITRRKLTDDRSQRLISAGLQGAERAATLVSRLLSFVGRQRLEPRAVSPSGLIEGMREMIDRTLGEGVEVRIEVPADLPAVSVDPAQLEVAIMNLVANAREAMPDGGRITISAEVADTVEDPVPGLAPGRYLSLAVADTGIGMDPEILPRAIEPFFTTKPAGSSSGLGLSMVHGLASQSGGTFRLLSEKGRGTAAVLFLPLAAQESAAADDPASCPVVLLVDDEEIVRIAWPRACGSSATRSWTWAAPPRRSRRSGRASCPTWW